MRISHLICASVRVVREAVRGLNGRRIDRAIGYALVRAGGSEAPDLVVFAEAWDMNLLGAHSLEGLNLKVDPVRKELVPVRVPPPSPWRQIAEKSL